MPLLDSPATNDHPREETRQQIAARLEQMIIDDVAAVNNRDFSDSSSLWQNKAPYWEAEVTASLSITRLTCEQFVNAVKARTEACPDYKLRIVDFTTTVDEQAGRAEIFANMELSGAFEGLSASNVTLCEYHRIDGKWYHAAHRTMPGMGPGMG